MERITIDPRTLDDYISILTSSSEQTIGSQMSDDEFLAYVNKLRKTK